MWSSSENEDYHGSSPNVDIAISLHFSPIWQSAYRISSAAVTALICFLKYFIWLLGSGIPGEGH